jgi:hypothetical protein
MRHFFDFEEYEIRKQFQRLEAVDRRLERWGWFRRHEGRPPETGWRFRAGKALIRLGRRLQEGGSSQPARVADREA